ncbi:hypothetical protein E7T09_18555 [Deinococcus sp. KSM4-11]|uniref:hypothetical protein n=1 Tax=Deinococcus sp. KSM4-11 TaxID=2568654 RepID=UPI0010A57F4F|nr:hypothetical protein [Deinococcus sp. KSM4-11]THF85041.1 hypothetical protein E7T09_18555 [Deinococcus sp. KSM4-11]
MKQTVPFLFSMTMLLASCAPTTAQTASGPQTIMVTGGAGYTLATKLPVEQLNAQTPDETAMTFTDCQGGAVRAADVRKFGAEVALKACQQAIQRSADVQNGLLTVHLILLPVTIVVGYFAVNVFACLFSFNANSPSCK